MTNPNDAERQRLRAHLTLVHPAPEPEPETAISPSQQAENERELLIAMEDMVAGMERVFREVEVLSRSTKLLVFSLHWRTAMFTRLASDLPPPLEPLPRPPPRAA